MFLVSSVSRFKIFISCGSRRIVITFKFVCSENMSSSQSDRNLLIRSFSYLDNCKIVQEISLQIGMVLCANVHLSYLQFGNYCSQILSFCCILICVNCTDVCLHILRNRDSSSVTLKIFAM